MALDIDFIEGSQTVSTTEWSLTTDTAGPDANTTVGIYTCHVDTNALAVGDVFVLRRYEKPTVAGTQRLYNEWTLTISNEKAFDTPAFFMGNGWDFTLLKLSGSDAAFTWSIRQVA